MEIEVDSPDDQDFEVRWSPSVEWITGDRMVKLILPIEEKHVAQNLAINVQIVSKKAWHRFAGGIDDGWHFTYKVLPPL